MAITLEVIKDMEGPMIPEEEAMEIKNIIEEEVGHLKDKTEVEDVTEVQVTIGLGQVVGQAQIGIELDALNVENTIILHENVQLD